MADGRGMVLGWSAGVSGAAGTLAALFANGKTRLDHVLFSVFVIAAAVAFVILLGVGLQGVISWWRGREQRPGRQQAALLTQSRLHDSKGRLPKVGDCTDPLALGVHPAAEPSGRAGQERPAVSQTVPPYVLRDADDMLADGFASGGLVIIEGASAAGKSRMAYQAMHRHAPGRVLIVPDNAASLRELKIAGVRLANAVVWLDDVDYYFAAGGLDASILDALCPRGRRDVLLLATLRSEARRYLDAEDLDVTVRRAIDEVMGRARMIPLARALSSAERDRAERQRAADARIARALDQHTGAGFAEYLAAAPAILRRWQSALDTVSGAIITAAVDARRAGILAPLTRDFLQELHAFYLDPRLSHLPGGSGFGEALAWATQPVEGASSCLTPLGAEIYAPFDYLLDYAQATISTPSVPAAVWPVLLAHARPTDLPSLGRAAYQAGRLDISETAFRRAASAMEDAVKSIPADQPERAAVASTLYAVLLSALGMVLWTRYQRSGDPADLEQAISAERDAVNSTSTGQPERAGMLSNLGIVLVTRYERSGDPADLEQAISAGRDAVNCTPADQPERTAMLSNLGNSLRRRFERSGDPADLDEAISVGRSAVNSASADQPERAAILSSLAMALQKRYERSGDLADLEEAINDGRDTVNSTPLGDPKRGGRLSGLSMSLRRRFDLTGDPVDLEEAASVGRDAVNSVLAGDPDRAGILANFGAVLRARFEQAGNPADLDEAISTGRDAVEITPAGDPQRAGRMSNLSVALLARFERTGEQADLDEAISIGQSAVEATPAGHPDHTTMLSNLNVALQSRRRRCGPAAP